MDYIVDRGEFIVEAIATHSEYLKNAVSTESSLTCPIPIDKSRDEDEEDKHEKRLRSLHRSGQG